MTEQSYEQTPAERIDNLRRVLHWNSLVYYSGGTPGITDARYDELSYELVDLQKEYPDEGTYLPELFADWDGHTGFHLTRAKYQTNYPTPREVTP